MRRVFGLILLAGFLLLSPHAFALTLSQLISDSRTLALDGASATRQRFSDSQITVFLNEAQQDAITQTRCIRQDQVFQLVPGTTYYPLPVNYLSMERLTIGYKYIQEMTPAALDGRSRAWENASGYPTYYFINWSSPTLVGFAPWPALSTDTDTIKMEYNVQVDSMVNGSDIPFNGIPRLYDYHHSLAYYAAMMMSAIDGQMGRQVAYQTMYVADMAGMAKRCLERPNYLPSATGSQ